MFPDHEASGRSQAGGLLRSSGAAPRWDLDLYVAKGSDTGNPWFKGGSSEFHGAFTLSQCVLLLLVVVYCLGLVCWGLDYKNQNHICLARAKSGAARDEGPRSCFLEPQYREDSQVSYHLEESSGKLSRTQCFLSPPPPSRSLSLARSPIPLSHVQGRRWPLHSHKSHRSVRTTSKAGCCLPSHFLRVSSWAKSVATRISHNPAEAMEEGAAFILPTSREGNQTTERSKLPEVTLLRNERLNPSPATFHVKDARVASLWGGGRNLIGLA